MSAERRRPVAVPAEPAVRDALGAGLDAPLDPDTARLAEFVAAAFGPGTRALVHYGSHVTAGVHRPGSARDFFVVVDDYRAAYAALSTMVETGLEPARAARLARRLAPNVVAVSAPEGALHAKCAVLSAAHFARLCSDRAPDHFTRGRLFQQVQLAWARDDAAREAARDVLLLARAVTWRWGRPYLPDTFDAGEYVRALLTVSFAAEIRPEAAGRVGELLGQQAAVLVPTYAALLEWLAERGELLREGPGRFRDPRPPTPAQRARSRAWFARSKARATLRWGKYVALYDDWLEYIVQKIERRSGVRMELSPRERRWPLVFLWPRAIRFLRDRPQKSRDNAR